MNKSKPAYKYMIYQTVEQKQLLARSLSCVCMIYNNTLRYRTNAFYKDEIKVSPSGTEKRLVQFKKETGASSIIFQQRLRYQQQTFKNFWYKIANYLIFKKKNGCQSLRLTKSGFIIKKGGPHIEKSRTPLIMLCSRVLQQNLFSLTISKDYSGRYFISMICYFNHIKLPKIDKSAGIDLVGLNQLTITSDSSKIFNLKHTKKYENKLEYLQKKLAKKKIGSINRYKVKVKVAKLHTKTFDYREDCTHKSRRKLINDNQVVCVESLKVKGMIKNPKLYRHIADYSLGIILRQLKYKADWYGRERIEIKSFFSSSKRCLSCEYINQELKLDISQWNCNECNTNHDRDINASINIKTAGLAGLVCGTTESEVVA